MARLPMELSSVAGIKAAPEAVWDVLVDFEQYGRWTKAVQMEGRPVLEGPAIYTLKVRTWFNPNRPLRVGANFSVVDKPNRLEWEIGLVWLLAFRVGFALTSAGGGVEVKHYASISGLFAPLLRQRFTRIMASFLQLVARDLGNRFSKDAHRASVAPNRHQRRKAEHRR